MKRHICIIFLFALLFVGCAQAGDKIEQTQVAQEETQIVQEGNDVMPAPENLRKATFAGGCFWCTEAIFQELEGVYKVTSGYTGGQVERPTYRAVCSGRTGHAEAVEIEYSPKEVTFEELLEVHFKTHNPTTLNRQGADHGTQYRSAVFYHDEAQKKATNDIIKQLTEEQVYTDPIVTEVTPASAFYNAEADHQDYYQNNTKAGYCELVITPKMEKFRKVFADKIKKAKSK